VVNNALAARAPSDPDPVVVYVIEAAWAEVTPSRRANPEKATAREESLRGIIGALGFVKTR
jgi:hypothetical protein